MIDFFPLELYNSLSDTIFPYELESGISLEELRTVCDLCDGDIHHLRIISSPITTTCYDLRLGGYCSKCGAYQTGRLRYHTKNRTFVEFSPDGDTIRRELQQDSGTTIIQSLTKLARKIFGK